MKEKTIMKEKEKQKEQASLNPRSRLAKAILEVRHILGKDRLQVKRENARKELAQDLWKVRHILHTEGIDVSYGGLSKDITNFVKRHPEIYAKGAKNVEK